MAPSSILEPLTGSSPNTGAESAGCGVTADFFLLKNPIVYSLERLHDGTDDVGEEQRGHDGVGVSCGQAGETQAEERGHQQRW